MRRTPKEMQSAAHMIQAREPQRAMKDRSSVGGGRGRPGTTELKGTGTFRDADRGDGRQGGCLVLILGCGTGII